jgi:hypothetical protein
MIILYFIGGNYLFRANEGTRNILFNTVNLMGKKNYVEI